MPGTSPYPSPLKPGGWPGLAWGGSREPVIACRLAIVRNINGHRNVLVPEILGE